jgi:hypothetical protein
VGASFQWVPVFSACESLVGASFQWVRVFSGCEFSVDASLQWVSAFSGYQSSVGTSLQWVPVFSGRCVKVMYQLACVQSRVLHFFCTLTRNRTLTPAHRLSFASLTYCANLKLKTEHIWLMRSRMQKI